jgi:hypothetical protein
MIESFLIYLVACLGVTYAWSDTDVARPFRNLVARIPYVNVPMLCHECSSFWFSLGISFLLNPVGELCVPFSGNLISAFCGFFANLVFVRNRLVAYKE